MILQQQHDQNRSMTEDCLGGSSWIPAEKKNLERNSSEQKYLLEKTKRKVVLTISTIRQDKKSLFTDLEKIRGVIVGMKVQ